MPKVGPNDSVSQQSMPNVGPNDSVSQQCLEQRDLDLCDLQNLSQPIPKGKATGPPALRTLQVTGPAAVQQWKRERAQESAQELVTSMPDWAPDIVSTEFLGMNDAEVTLRSEEAVLAEPQPSSSMSLAPDSLQPPSFQPKQRTDSVSASRRWKQ